MRWRKAWETEDRRGCVQCYNAPGNLSIFDAWLDGKYLGQTHRLGSAKQMVMEAMVAS